MGNLLAIGAAWLEAQRAAGLSETVTYSRGGASVQLAASRGRSEHARETTDGLVTVALSADWLLGAADLVLGDELAEPAPGDRIAASAGTFEVLPPSGSGTDCWRWEDGHGRTMRVHTKRIEK